MIEIEKILNVVQKAYDDLELLGLYYTPKFICVEVVDLFYAYFVFRLYTVVFHTFYASYRFYPPFHTFCILLVKSQLFLVHIHPFRRS